MTKFVHPELNMPVEFFGGSYFLTEEGIIHLQGKEVLYFVGVAGLDASCCGRSGCAFIKVPGFLMSGERKHNGSGRSISEVSPIVEDENRKRVNQILKEKYPEVTQIEFF